MHGTGVRVRHLKLKSLADVQTEAARSLLGAAREQAVVCLEDRSVVGAEVTPVMKGGKMGASLGSAKLRKGPRCGPFFVYRFVLFNRSA